MARIATASTSFQNSHPPFYFGLPEIQDGTQKFFRVNISNETTICWIGNAPVLNEVSSLLKVVRESALAAAPDDATRQSLSAVLDSLASTPIADYSPEQQKRLYDKAFTIPHADQAALQNALSHQSDPRWDTWHQTQARQLLSEVAMPAVKSK